MTSDRLKIYSIKYLVEYIEKAEAQNCRINILTAAGLIEGKVLIFDEENTKYYPDFIKGMIESYVKNYNADDPFMDDQRNTFIAMENAVLICGGLRTHLKHMIIYLDDIIGIAMTDKA